ncbi:hypothetical protein DL1_20620 [Thioclava dalianensis]|uniref:Uncharacterized protein n=1 Tax=Thioclava dalianensis TaxID=1185766 RepID=A0A074TIB4_9RHOB|nr:hypothetical protein [Thioclava dalianensis]KEP69900.1 hypothetical protein DL1_20620 [Thioclava dalianensis]SFN17038.1 hypothetical protein SAMN05216224_102771 [Thioclava dalianensis]
MIRLLLVMILLMTGPAFARERPQGLMWSQTDLPRTLPLQIKSRAGRDVYLVLRDVQSGQDILGAYLRGGSFFRLLVPPGEFELMMASGPAADWEGREKLFGPQTRRFRLDPPLRFATTGLARKGGHLIDLRNLGDITQSSFGLCQSLALDLDSVRTPPTSRTPEENRDNIIDFPDFPVPRYRDVSRICD